MSRKAKQLSENHKDLEDLDNELEELQQKLKQRKDEYFQLQRESLKCKSSPPKQKSEPFLNPEKVILSNNIVKMKNDLQLMSMLPGVEVKSYVMGEHCSIVFHMQHDSEHALKHGLRIELQSGTNVVSKSSLPLGFNIKAVLDDYDNIMIPECLESIQGALMSYYDRLEQYDKLKGMLQMEADLFRVLDGSHIELTFIARSDIDPEGTDIELILVLDYSVYDIRPKLCSFKELDLPEGAAAALKEQCLVFKKKPLNKAFKEAFITGIGPFKLVQRIGTEENKVVRKRKTFRSNRLNYNNDDTFHPEDCSGLSEDEEMPGDIL